MTRAGSSRVVAVKDFSVVLMRKLRNQWDGMPLRTSLLWPIVKLAPNFHSGSGMVWYLFRLSQERAYRYRFWLVAELPKGRSFLTALHLLGTQAILNYHLSALHLWLMLCYDRKDVCRGFCLSLKQMLRKKAVINRTFSRSMPGTNESF